MLPHQANNPSTQYDNAYQQWKPLNLFSPPPLTERDVQLTSSLLPNTWGVALQPRTFCNPYVTSALTNLKATNWHSAEKQTLLSLQIAFVRLIWWDPPLLHNSNVSSGSVISTKTQKLPLTHPTCNHEARTLFTMCPSAFTLLQFFSLCIFPSLHPLSWEM